MARHGVAFVDQPVVYGGRGVARHTEEIRRLPGGRQFRPCGKPPIENRGAKFAMQRPRGVARALGSQLNLKLEQGIDGGFWQRL
jgi:hypothetical protein